MVQLAVRIFCVELGCWEGVVVGVDMVTQYLGSAGSRKGQEEVLTQHGLFESGNEIKMHSEESSVCFSYLLAQQSEICSGSYVVGPK